MNSTSVLIRMLAVAVVSGVLAVVAFAAGGMAGLALGATTTFFALAALTSGLVIARIYASVGVPRASTAAAFFPATLAPLSALLAAAGLRDPIVRSHWHCGTGDMMVVMVAVPLFGVLGAVGGLLSLPVAGAPRALNGRLLRALSIGTFALLAVLMVYGGWTRTRLPDPSGYVASLPVAATVKALRPERAPDKVEKQEDGLETRVFKDLANGTCITVERRCGQHRGPQGEVVPSEYCSVLLRTTGAEPASYPQASVHKDAPIVLRRDEAHHLWVVTGAGNTAYRDGDNGLHAMDVYVGDVRGSVAAPWGLIAAAFGALVAWMGIEARRRRAERERERIESAREGTLGEGGWITIEGEAMPLRASPDLGLTSGPVLVMPQGPKAPSGAYRGETPLGKGAVLGGEQGEWLERVRTQMATLDALGTSVAAFGAAPLLAAWLLLQ